MLIKKKNFSIEGAALNLLASVTMQNNVFPLDKSSFFLHSKWIQLLIAQVSISASFYAQLLRQYFCANIFAPKKLQSQMLLEISCSICFCEKNSRCVNFSNILWAVFSYESVFVQLFVLFMLLFGIFLKRILGKNLL